MPRPNLSDVPVELFEKVLEDLDIFDILHLKLVNRQAYHAICCSNRTKYRVELFLAGAEDGNHYSLAERRELLHSYCSNWDNLTPQKTTMITIPYHAIYELAGGVYGLLPTASPNSLQFYRLPSVSRRIEMEVWTLKNLDFTIDDFTMECAHDLLTIFTYKTGHVQVHLLKLSDGKPHPRTGSPLLEYDIPLNPTESGWRIESVIWGDKLGCLFTSTSEHESVDVLVVWDWTTGDLVRVLPQCGNSSFVFLDDQTIVAGHTTEDGGPSLAFFHLASDQEPALTLALPNVDPEDGVSWRIQLNLGSPIRHGPETQVRVPFFISPSQQMLFVLTFIVDSEGIAIASDSIAVSLSKLRDWTREGLSFVDWEDWEKSTVPIPAGDPCRATFTMGSRFVFPNSAAFIVALLPFIVEPALVYNLSPHRLKRVEWDSSLPHCQGIPGVWNTVTRIQEDGSRRRFIQIPPESTLDVFMTEDNLVMLEMGLADVPDQQLKVLSF